MNGVVRGKPRVGQTKIRRLWKGDLRVGLTELLLTDSTLIKEQEKVDKVRTLKEAERKYDNEWMRAFGDLYGKCHCNDKRHMHQQVEDADVKDFEFTGNSMVISAAHWYTRAALIFWPRSHRADAKKKMYRDGGEYRKAHKF